MVRKRRFSLFGCVARLVLWGGAVWLLCLASIAVWARGAASGEADAIVVLGAAQYAGRPSPVLQARLDHALSLWRDGRAHWVVLTGGKHPGDDISEAAAGSRYLERNGVPRASILMEQQGRTSLASIEGASELLSEQSELASLSRPPRVLLVSDPFHMLRLDVLARLHGLSPMRSPTRTSPISANKAVLEYMLRESVALPADVAIALWMRLTADLAPAKENRTRAG